MEAPGADVALTIEECEETTGPDPLEGYRVQGTRTEVDPSG